MSTTLLTTELVLFNTKVFAAGLREITLPSAQFCVDQNKNSLIEVSQLLTFFKSTLNSSKTNPCASKYTPYPCIKSTIDCIEENLVP